MKKQLIILLVLLAGMSTSIKAQILQPVKWSYAAKKLNNREAVLLFKATMEDNWHIYSAYQKNGGPVKTSFTFTPEKGYAITSKITEPQPITEFEKSFSMDVSYFTHEVIFQQKIRLTNPGKPVTVKGSLNFMVCNNEKCLPPEDVAFSIPVK